MKNCIFCQIIDRKAPAYILYEDNEIISFLSLENHPLIVPKRHLPDLFSLDEALASAVMRASLRVARALRTGLACDGIYVTQANGACAGQDVFHYHMHLYPRWNDRVSRHLKEERETLRERIVKELG